jgi:glycosyltransferase involved in cell wall biosynthesis
MERRLRVLVLTTLFPHQPGEKEGNFILDQVRVLAEQGADVTVLVAKPWIPVRYLAPHKKRKIDKKIYAGERFRVRNAQYFSLPRFALGARAYDFARSGVLPEIREMAQEEQFDVVHAHGILMGHVGVQFGRVSGVPTVVTIHGIETDPRFDNTEGKRAKIAEVLEKSGRVLLVGSPLLEHCRKYTKKDSFAVVGNGFTIYPDIQASQRIPRRKPVRVAAVSNYEESKGFDLLVEAVANEGLWEKIELVIVGGGAGFKRVQQRVSELGLEGSVHFTGLLPHSEALAEVMAADVFCLPSWREAFGIMYAEAMALGKFAIGCKGQGPSYFMQHMETGYLLEPGSTGAVAQALRWVMEEPERAKEIAKRGQEYALRSLTWDANATKLLAIYREMIAKKNSLRQTQETAASKQDRTAPV